LEILNESNILTNFGKVYNNSQGDNMRIFTRIVQIMFILAGLVLTCFLAFCWIKPEALIVMCKYIETNLLQSGLLGFVFILIGIIWLVYWFDFLVRSRTISIDNPHGKVRISLKAIEEFIDTKINLQMKNIKSIRVKTSLGSHGLETVIHMKIASGYNIPELTSQIQELIKNYLQDVVGVERVSHIEIIITNLTPSEEETNLETEDENEKTTD